MQHPQRTQPSAPNLISSQTKLHNSSTNKIFYEPASPQRFYYHQARFTRASERSITHRKKQPGLAFLKIHQKVKSTNIKKNLHQRMDKTASQHHMAVTLNLNGLNPPIKRHSQNPMACYIQTCFTCKDTQRLKTKGWRKIYQPNGEQK